MYWVRKIEIASEVGKVKPYLYLLCDSFEEFAEDIAGVVDVPFLWDAQIGKLPRLEARARNAKKGAKLLKWQKDKWRINPHLSPNVKSVMNELGAVISATVVSNLYSTEHDSNGRKVDMLEIRELVFNKKEGNEFFITEANMPGYESIFDSTINKESQCAAGTNSDYADAYRDIAQAYKVNFDYGRAIENYTKAIEINPNDVATYHARGYAYSENGDYDRAIEDFTRTIELAPGVFGYFDRGYVYANKGDYDKAIADCTRVIELVPNWAMAYHNRGFVYDKKGDTEKAEADYAKAKELGG